MIYVMNHKKIDKLPKDYPLPEHGYIVLNLEEGANISGPIENINDNEKENIRELNPFINECTGMYYINKNCEDDIIGVCHYRRFLYNKNEKILLYNEEIYSILREYKVITQKPITINNYTIYEHLKIHGDINHFTIIYNSIMENLIKYYPDYIDSFNIIMNGNEFVASNLFIMRKELFKEYTDWLFTLILPVANSEKEIIKYRYIGYFAERLFSVWLLKKKSEKLDFQIYYANAKQFGEL